MIDQEESARILYGSFAPRDVPRYTIAQAARYLGLSPTTLRSWVRGRSYPRRGESVRSEPLIKAADLLSFSNLVEAHILRALRRDEDVRMSFLRTALALAEREYRIDRLLLSEQLRAAPGEVLLEQYGKLINLGRAGRSPCGIASTLTSSASSGTGRAAPSSSSLVSSACWRCRRRRSRG